jgi:hypothetical protein
MSHDISYQEQEPLKNDTKVRINVIANEELFHNSWLCMSNNKMMTEHDTNTLYKPPFENLRKQQHDNLTKKPSTFKGHQLC